LDKVGSLKMTTLAENLVQVSGLQGQRLGGFDSAHGLVGGTHLAGRSDAYLEQTIRAIRGFGLRLFSPCHCTGFKATARLWREFPEAFILNYSGRVIEAGKEPDPRVI